MSENDYDFKYPDNYDKETGVYKLLHPFKGNGQSYEEITLRRLKFKEVREAIKKKDQLEINFFYVKKSTGMPDDDLDEMDAQDIRNIKDIVSTFL